MPSVKSSVNVSIEVGLAPIEKQRAKLFQNEILSENKSFYMSVHVIQNTHTYIYLGRCIYSPSQRIINKWHKKLTVQNCFKCMICTKKYKTIYSKHSMNQGTYCQQKQDNGLALPINLRQPLALHSCLEGNCNCKNYFTLFSCARSAHASSVLHTFNYFTWNDFLGLECFDLPFLTINNKREVKFAFPRPNFRTLTCAFVKAVTVSKI